MEKVISNNNVKSTRDISIDIYKAFLIFLIVLGHTMVTSNPIGIFLSSFHVPAFFLLAGYTYKQTKCFGKFVLKKFIRLLIPYFLVSLISIFIFYFFGDYVAEKLMIDIKSTEIMPNILGMLYGNGQTGYMKWNLPLWFIPALFSALIIYYWVDKLISIIPVNKTIAKLFFLLFFLGFAFMNYNTFKFKNLVFGIDNALYNMPFILLGSILKDLFDKKNIKWFVNLILGIIAVGLGTLLVFIARKHGCDYVGNSFGSIYLFYLSSALLSVGFLFIFKLFKKGRFFAEIGKRTLFILLFHKFFIVLYQINFKKYLLENPLDMPIGLGVALVITLFLFGVGFLFVLILKLIFRRKKKQIKQA